MVLSKMERLKLIMKDDEWPVSPPAHTDEELRAAAPDGSRPENPVGSEFVYNLLYGHHSLTSQQQHVKSEPTSNALSAHEDSSEFQSTFRSTTPKANGQSNSKMSTKKIESLSRSVDKLSFDDHTDVKHADCGKLAAIDEAFCPIDAISKYPYKFVDKDLVEPVADACFNEGKFWRRKWNIYYLWPEGMTTNKPLLLTTVNEVENLLQDVRKALPHTMFILGAEAESFGLVLRFDGHSTLRPRFLGQSTSKEKFSSLSKHVPPSYFRPEGEKDSSPLPEEQIIEEWRRKMELAFEVSKGKSQAAKNAKKEARQEKQKHWKADLKTAERFLGLRPLPYDGLEIPKGASWQEEQALRQNIPDDIRPAAIDASKPVPYHSYKYPILISLDIECYEHDKSKITEVGISTLDTLSLTKIPPGPMGQNWKSNIRARHFRIRDYMHLNNSDFVVGCADKFEFGTSDIVNKADAPATIAACFRPPYCAPSDYIPKHPNGTKLDPTAQRHIALIGHDITQDIRYLRILGYDISNLSNHLTIVDTASLHRVLNHSWNAKSLAGVLYEFDIPAFNLHNGGNDAFYTLQAMLAICVKSASERDSKERKKRLETARDERVKEHVARETERALQEEKGWSSEASL